MSQVVIDGIEYVPRAKVPELSDARLKAALEVLTEIQYFKQTHKAIPQAWNALNALAPELAELAAINPKAAYDRIHNE
uniref:Uncharacterized protein n=1 Tax=Pseudomonas fluorescens (strain SBW25) TaxID=216595 RepID=A0A0G4E5L8_PSEFS|nr:hypothetical protein [Pseudomonas fluorescens]CEK42318.1 hypothetical protein PQBR57_0365 [Pseudomonas fluorescens SBW25]